MPSLDTVSIGDGALHTYTTLSGIRLLGPSTHKFDHQVSEIGVTGTRWRPMMFYVHFKGDWFRTNYGFIGRPCLKELETYIAGLDTDYADLFALPGER